jgi:hypothetical protein
MFELIAKNFLDESIQAFENYKKLSEKAFSQISDEEFFKTIDEEANSIAVIAKHIGGNLRSRWSDFLTSDGEKADRDRDAEFVAKNESRGDIMQIWERGWQTLFDTLKSLVIEDLGKTVKIRGEDFTVTKAISRSVTHTAYHVGQIVLFAKHFRSAEWQPLSIPRNKSIEFNQFLAGNEEKGNYLEAGQKFAEKER